MKLFELVNLRTIAEKRYQYKGYLCLTQKELMYGYLRCNDIPAENEKYIFLIGKLEDGLIWIEGNEATINKKMKASNICDKAKFTITRETWIDICSFQEERDYKKSLLKKVDSETSVACRVVIPKMGNCSVEKPKH